jgi:hypothetical protein
MTALDVLVIAYEALSPDEQDELLASLNERRLEREAGRESETARYLRDLRRAAELIGPSLSYGDYRDLQRRLAQDEDGEQLTEINRLMRHFGSWRLAKEAFQLARLTTARGVEARFRKRKLGKTWRYTDETLKETVWRCAEEIGHCPQLAEYDWWREREFQLAEAEGNDAFHLPSGNPYRRRWGTWANALRQLGFSQAEIEGRLERP